MNDKKKASEKAQARSEFKQIRIGAKMSFAAKESYKQLRTNLDFSLADVEGCKVIGVTSGLRGEGKSMTTGNLSYTLAEAGFRVLLIEGDMRLPNLAKRLQLPGKVGLSNVLSQRLDPAEAIQVYHPLDTGAATVYCISAGSIPPNPSELLSSNQMKQMIDRLKEEFDYIILDLPPVTAVTDAQAVSKYLNGMLVVVRQDYSLKSAVAETIRQLKFSNVRILGFVCTFVSDDSGSGYSRRYRYRRNYKYYGSSYQSDSDEKTEAEG